VIVILDASTLINLDYGEVLSDVLSLPNRDFKISETVLQESRTVVRAIQAAIRRGDIEWVDASVVDADDYKNAILEWGLGAGETECILAAQALVCTVACDDKAARKVLKRKLPSISLTGSIGLLRDIVVEGAKTVSYAYAAYQSMRAHGGYLPEYSFEGFEGFILSRGAVQDFPDAMGLER
jgi:predicted nucleic acid-binding protein